MFKKLVILTALTLGLSAQAETTSCGTGDLVGATFLKCAGYESGNLISNSPDSLAKMAQLFTQLGYEGTNTTWTEKLTNITGTTIDFNTNLTGTVLLAVHHGGGSPSQSTAVYVLDAGTGTDKLNYNLQGLSNAAIYQVPVSPVPEPGTWALFLAGLSAVVFAAKRRLK